MRKKNKNSINAIIITHLMFALILLPPYLLNVYFKRWFMILVFPVAAMQLFLFFTYIMPFYRMQQDYRDLLEKKHYKNTLRKWGRSYNKKAKRG